MNLGSPKSGHARTAEISVRTERRIQLLEVTAAVARLVQDAAVHSGVCYIHVPHTTAGVIVNENADPDVAADIERTLVRLVPHEGDYRHSEGNSDAHVKSALVGTSVTVFIAEGRLDLGRWQGIFFAEFDGPRTRRLCLKILPD